MSKKAKVALGIGLIAGSPVALVPAFILASSGLAFLAACMISGGAMCLIITRL